MKQAKQKVVIISVSLPNDLILAIEKEAEKDSRTRSSMIAIFLREAVARHRTAKI